MKETFIRNPYNYDTKEASRAAGLDTGTEGGAKQSFKDECDINTIIKNFGLAATIGENYRMPEYQDFTGTTDFHTAMNQVRHAQENFNELPAHLREKFNNDPQRLMQFVHDGNNFDEAERLGLLSQEAIERVRNAKETRQQQSQGGGSQNKASAQKSQQSANKTGGDD